MGKLVTVEEQAERDQHLARWSAGGLTKAAYCHEHGLNRSSFRHWVSNKQKASASQAGASMTMVPVVRKPTGVAGHAESTALTLQHHHGWRIDLPTDVSLDWLAQLLRKLAC